MLPVYRQTIETRSGWLDFLKSEDKWSANLWTTTQPSEGLVAVAVLHISTGGIAEAAHEITSSAVPRKLLIYEFPLLAGDGSWQSGSSYSLSSRGRLVLLTHLKICLLAMLEVRPFVVRYAFGLMSRNHWVSKVCLDDANAHHIPCLQIGAQPL